MNGDWRGVFREGGAQIHANALAVPATAAPGAAHRAVIDAGAAAAARREIATWPGYAPTPLRALPQLAAELGLAGLHLKDESPRFGLGSFKALGGAYAVFRILANLVEAATGTRGVTSDDLRSGKWRGLTGDVVAVTATDGNHGKSVAWGAREFGCRSRVYIHADVSPGREQAIAAYGAEMVRTAGDYDDSVRQAAADAAAEGWIVVSDTSYGDYREIPCLVMHGYTMTAAEAVAQTGAVLPTHVFVQGGVGGIAAAVCAELWRVWGARRPRFVVVEPERADCLYQTALAGRPAKSTGNLDTVMACLAAGEVSLAAWDVLAEGAGWFMTLPDATVPPVMRRLADAGVVAGESGAAGLAGLAAAALDPAIAAALGLGPESRVLVFSTEGATDPEIWARIVGRPPQSVAP